ncbi:putative transposase, mutator type, MULE transposase domain protein [Tanacetum coccineum]
MLRVFPISLTGAASYWLRNEPTGSIKTWEDLKTKFLNKYCPPGRTAKKMEKINNFQQEPNETLYQAWERFKELLMKCPQHYLTEMQEVILFYNGLDVPTRQILNSRGVVPTKTATSDGLAAIQAQLNNLGREIKKVNEKVYAAQVGCEQCKGPHYTKDCPQKEDGKEEAYYMLFGGPFQGGGYRATTPRCCHKELRSIDQNFRNTNRANEQGTTTERIWKLPSFNLEQTTTRTNVKSISTTFKADSNSIRRIGSNQYAVSTGQNSTLLYKSRQTMVPFPSCLDNHYYE